jgi:rod shape-determining protein MreB and related proteins
MQRGCIRLGFGLDIAIDLGTATVLVYIKGKGIVLQEPSVVALDKETNKMLAVGEEARRMLGRTPGNIIALRPLREGVISDYNITERMLKYFIKKVCKSSLRLFKPRIMVCVPSGVTEVERRAVVDAAMQAGARKTYLIEEPIAAAIGAGIDISKACGSMVVDVGGGTTDIAVMSLGGTVVSASIKIAGDKMDEAIVRHMRKKHNVMIGERTAEDLKVNIGTVYPRVKEVSMDIRGRNLVSGLPKTLTITSSEIMEALDEPVASIVEAVFNVLERTPPELASDIGDRGIVMTGGGSLVYGLDKLLQERTGINVIIADGAVSCVALGTGEALENIETIEQIVTEDRRIRR